MHEARLTSFSVVGDEFHALVDYFKDGQLITMPGFRDAIADAVALALGNPLPSDPDPIPLNNHVTIIPIAAVASRMLMYGLKTPEEGLSAILKEHLARLAPDITTPPTREDAILQMQSGGDVGDLTVKGTRTHAEKAWKRQDVRKLLKEARGQRLQQEPSNEE